MRKRRGNQKEREFGKSNSSFHSDAAIKQIEEDELDRSIFAGSLAKALSKRPVEGSLIVSLVGKWGEGKTSLVNLILKYFEKNHPEVQARKFPVWSLTNREEILDGFYSTVENAIGKSTSDKTLQQKAARWRLTAARVEVFGAWVPLLGAVLIGAGATLTATLAEHFGTGIGILTSLIITILSFFFAKYSILASIIKKISDLRRTQATIRRENLEGVKKELQDALQKSDSTVVIVVDDMDRLAPDEVKLLFQLLKGNGDLPNLIYILPYDEDLLAKSIEKALPNTEGHGSDYLDKIVQIQFRVPPPSVTKVHEILTKRLNELIGPTIGPEAEATRWTRFSQSGVFIPFKTLRDVYRFLNSFRVSLALFDFSRINKTDLLILEIIKFFESKLYFSLPLHKSDLIVRKNRDFKGLLEGTEKEILDELCELSSSANLDTMKGLLLILFPQQGHVISTEEMDEAYRLYRVAHPERFDRYFSLLLPEAEIYPTEHERMMKARASARELAAVFTEIINSKREVELLGHVLYHRKELAELAPQEFVRSFFLIESSLKQNRNDLWVRPESSIYLIVKETLRAYGLERRVSILENALSFQSGLYIPVFLATLTTDKDYNLFEPDPMGTKRPSNQRLRTKEEEEAWRKERTKSIQSHARDRIEKASKTEELLDHPRLITILYRWLEWGNKDNISAWLRNRLDSAEDCIKLLKACEYTAVSVGINVGEPTTSLTREVHQYSDIIKIARNIGCGKALESVPVLIEATDPERAKILREFLQADRQGVPVENGEL